MASLLQKIDTLIKANLHALVDVLVKFSQLPYRYHEIVEADLNPVFVRSDGVLVGDVRIIHKEQIKG